MALVLWLLGHRDEAMRARHDALAVAAEVGHPYTTTTTRIWDAMLSLERRDYDAVRASTAALTASGTHEPPARQTQAVADALQGFVEVLDGAIGAGIARIQHALDQISLIGPTAPGLQACLLRILLEACAVGDDASTGLTTAERLLAEVGGGAVWGDQARRLRGAFLDRDA